MPHHHSSNSEHQANAGLPLALAIETSGRSGSVALGTQFDNLVLETVHKASRHDDDLMPAIDRLFQRTNVTPRQLQEVRVSTGPGGFTGLRVGIATAKMLALAIPGLRIVAVPTAWILAQSVMDGAGQPAKAGDSALVLMSGKRGSWWGQTFEVACSIRDGDIPMAIPGGTLASGAVISWQNPASPIIMRSKSEERLELSNYRRILIEPSDAALSDLLDQNTKAMDDSHVIRANPTASTCWLAGCQLSERGAFSSPEALLPLYVREPEAMRLWEQKKARGQSIQSGGPSKTHFE